MNHVKAHALVTVAALALLLGSAAVAAEATKPAEQKPAAVAAKITLKKQEQGALELSNLSDEEEDAEVLVEGKESAKSEAGAAPEGDAPQASRRGERQTAERPQTPGRTERATGEEPRRNEPMGTGSPEHAGGAGPSYVWGAATTSTSGVGVVAGDIAGAAAAGAPAAAANAGSDPGQPTAAAASSANVVLPNPRAGTENAVPSNAGSADPAALADYANRMVQSATSANANRSLKTMENPAAARRYLMINKSSYQAGSGR